MTEDVFENCPVCNAPLTAPNSFEHASEANQIETMCRRLAEYLKSKGELREAFTAKFIAQQISEGVYLDYKPPVDT